MAAYNVQSLFIFYAILSLFAGAIACLFFKRLDSSARYWAVGTLLAGVTNMATVFRAELPLLWSYSVAIGVSGAAFALMGMGMARLYDTRPPRRQLMALALGTLLYIVLMEWCRLYTNPKVTLVLSGLLFGLTSLWGAYPSHVHYKRTGNRFSMHMRWVMAGLGLLQLLRMQGALTGWGVQTFGPDAWTLGIWSSIYVFGMLRYFTYIGVRLQQQYDERFQTAVALGREEEARRLGAQLARLERQQSLGMMSASFAHELNQPLTSIMNYADLLKHQQNAGIGSSQQTQTILDHIIANTDRAGDIIRRIRTFIQPTEIKPQRIDLRVVVDEVMSLAAPQASRSNIRVIKDAMPEAVWVMADPVQISQVLFNVLRNAMEAVSTSAVCDIRIALNPGGGEVELRVQDTGVGLTPEQARQAGDAFYSTKITGLGMGLSISKTILAQYGGRLTLTANEGQGATASIFLPQASAL